MKYTCGHLPTNVHFCRTNLSIKYNYKYKMAPITTELTLTPEAVEAIKESQDCRNRLAFKMKRSSRTIDRYLAESPVNIFLTTAQALEIISEETGIAKSKLLTKQ